MADSKQPKDETDIEKKKASVTNTDDSLDDLSEAELEDVAGGFDTVTGTITWSR